MLPRPRNFVVAQYQIRRTASGSLPTDDDIMHIINVGMPGTAMPGWEDVLSENERKNLVAYIKTFSRFFQTDKPNVLEFAQAAGGGDDAIKSGRAAYMKLECWKCHGEQARGDGPSASTQEDESKMPIRPADLTQPWLFNGGGTVEDIYRRLRTGLDGTPMPSLSDALAAGIVKEDQLWAMAHYIRSLAPEDPVVREVIEAKRVDKLPASLDDSTWNGVARSWIPLVGQIIVKPRWFAPAVTGVWVQALNDRRELMMRVSWKDRLNSPDANWSEWHARVTQVMFSDGSGGGGGTTTSSTSAAGPPPNPPPNPPPPPPPPPSGDALAVWFPRHMATGMERPYFFMGSARDPVYAWRWQSRGPAEEMLGKGPGKLEKLGSNNGLAVQGVFDKGQWRVLFRRTLAAADSVNALTFPVGQPVPVAFFASDGDNGEQGTQGSLSTWYFVYLAEPTSSSVYATPLIATLLTAAVGVFVVRRAQKNPEGSNHV
jgi:mono/diheme cytochrome c family protein